jgi:hypothetical protein
VLITAALSAFSAQRFTEFFSFSLSVHNVALGLIGGLGAAWVIEGVHRIHRKDNATTVSTRQL